MRWVAGVCSSIWIMSPTVVIQLLVLKSHWLLNYHYGFQQIIFLLFCIVYREVGDFSYMTAVLRVLKIYMRRMWLHPVTAMSIMMRMQSSAAMRTQSLLHEEVQSILARRHEQSLDNSLSLPLRLIFWLMVNQITECFQACSPESITVDLNCAHICTWIKVKGITGKRLHFYFPSYF